MNINLRNLETEQINQNTKNIDMLSVTEILQTINHEDQSVAMAVEKVIPSIAELVDNIINSFMKGGRLFYIGAGTSGRLGFLDAAECPPTYGVDSEMVQGIIAGGYSSLYKAKEGAEDDPLLGRNDLIEYKLTCNDVVVGIAASGRTPYVVGALEYANEIGAYTGSIACVSNSLIGNYAKTKIEAVTGQEVITGSTRMKAGTAQKLILNMLSTTAMIKLGKVYENMMVDVKPTNEKLVDRAISIIQKCVNVSYTEAKSLLNSSEGNVKAAICMGITKMSREKCIEKLEECNGHIREVISQYQSPPLV